MPCKPFVDFFLGSLSPAGFTGWFDQAAAEKGSTAYLIRSGPGCGKSTLMRRLAAADAGHYAPRGTARIERIHCSSDPDSLDGVLLSDVGALFLDATAPHTLDCKYPGAAERVVSLYDTLDNAHLAQNSARILALGAENGALLQRAAASYALACGLLAERRALAAQALDGGRLQRFGHYLAAKTLPKKRCAAPGRQTHRLLSAPTPQGLVVYRDTVTALADTIYVLQDPDGAAAPLLLAQLADYARANGYDVVLCHCASDQTRLDHLLLPAQRLAFVTGNPWHPMALDGQHDVRLRRFYDGEARKAQRAVLARQRHGVDSLLRRTCTLQAQAKAVHDELERYYIAAVDFSAVDAVRMRLEKELFGQTVL